jgi:hypothetical protein
VATLLRLHHHTSRGAEVKAAQPRLPDWCLAGFCIIYSLAFTGFPHFLLFARRYAFVSGPVLGEMGLMMALSAAIAFLAA